MATSSQKLAASRSTLISLAEDAARQVGGIPAIALGMVLPMAEPMLDSFLADTSDADLDRLLVRGAQWLLSNLSDGHPATLFIPAVAGELEAATDD